GTSNSPDVIAANSVTATLASADFTPVNGAVASNYSLPGTASGAGHIAPATLTASVIGDPTKRYDGNANAILNSANYSLSGFVGSQSFTVTKASGTNDSLNGIAANTWT